MSFLSKMEVRENYRNEIKFTLEKFDRTNFIYNHSNKKFLLTEPYERRWINNIYFDTENYSLYMQSKEGSSQRIKIRLRWYGDYFGVIEPTLEFKIKKGHKNTKKTFNLDKFNLFDGISKRNIMNFLNESKKIPKHYKFFLKRVSPVLCNRYFRSYHVSKKIPLRVTFDTNLNFQPINLKQKISDNFIINTQFSIMELKFSSYKKSITNFLTQINLKTRPVQISKYTFGMHAR